MAIEYYSSIDLNKNELQNAVIQNAGSAPGSPAEGQIYYDSTSGDKALHFYNGSAWIRVAGQATAQATDTIASGDFIAFSDESETGDINNKITIDNLFTTAPALLTEAAIADGDYIVFLDGGASGDAKKEALADLATLFAGTGLGASSSVLSIDAAQTGITSLLATDIKIGEDDQTKIDFEDANKINFYANNAKEVELAENSLSPGTSDGTALGTTSLMWSDLFLASGGVVNFNNGDVTLTHSSNTLTVAGGTLATAALTASTGTFSGILKTDDTTDATSTTDGALQTDGGLSVAKDAVIGDDLMLLSDSAILSFGANKEVQLKHDHNSGLILQHTATADGAGTVFTISSAEAALTANEEIGAIAFDPSDSDGTDGTAVSARIAAVAEGTFAADNNATRLEFQLGQSEAASTDTARMTLSSAGLLTITDDLVIKDGGTIGVSSANDAMTISSGGIVTFKDDIIIKDGGTIGVASDADSITIDSSGNITASQNLTVSGNLTVTGTTTQVDTVTMNAQNAVVFEGATADAHETTLTIVDPTADHTYKLPDLGSTADVGFIAAFEADPGTSGLITATPAEINLVDGGTSRGTTAVADGDGFLHNDGGTMRMTNVSKIADLFAGTGLSASSSVLSIDAAQTGITSLLATDIKIGEDDQTKIDFETADEIHFYAANVEQVYLADNIFGPQSDSDVDLGSNGVRWKDAYMDNLYVTSDVDINGDVDVDGTLETDALTIAGTAIVAQATASAVGGVELATAAEVITGTDAARVVTADTLSAKSVVCDIDVSSLTDANIVTITHNLGTADILVQVYDKTTEANIMCDIARTTDDFSTASTSVVSIDFGTAPPNDCRALITSLAGATAGSIAYT